jgi:hypothetical protein
MVTFIRWTLVPLIERRNEKLGEKGGRNNGTESKGGQ